MADDPIPSASRPSAAEQGVFASEGRPLGSRPDNNGQPSAPAPSPASGSVEWQRWAFTLAAAGVAFAGFVWYGKVHYKTAGVLAVIVAFLARSVSRMLIHD